MKSFLFYYTDGSELKKNDRVLINTKQIARVNAILVPGTKEASNYSCKEGGFVLVFENGDVQVWPDTDEDILLIERNREKTDQRGVRPQ